jgi:hypothetical protein
MAYLEDYNQMISNGGYLITTESRIRQYLEIKKMLIIRTQPKKGDSEFSARKGCVFCYDEYGEMIWEFKEEGISEINVKDNKLFIYVSSSLGYEYEIDYKNGNKLKINIVK